MMLLRGYEELNVVVDVVVGNVLTLHWQRYYYVTFLWNRDRHLSLEVVE